jgi:hypothetical protein
MYYCRGEQQSTIPKHPQAIRCGPAHCVIVSFPQGWARQIRRDIAMNTNILAHAATRPRTRLGMPQPSLTIRLRRLLRHVQRRREEQRMAMLLEELGHPGLIADFRRASRG